MAETMAALFASAAAAAGTSATAGTAAAGTAAAGTAAAAGALPTLGGTAAAITGAELFTSSALAGASAAGGGVTLGALGAASASGLLGGAFDTLSLVGDVVGAASAVGQARQTAADRELQGLTIRNQQMLDNIAAIEQLRADIGSTIAAGFAGNVAPTGSVQSGIERATRLQEFETQVGGRDARMRAMQLDAEAEASRNSVSSIMLAGLSDMRTKDLALEDRRLRRG
ncbi:MAG: hypothetical protein Unbinned4026contig1001_9 [Prokaryotic dsDNA virus sp.]|nr:MAG: hypothetical protein Unbinned4026contig1001_9 [Prokaryotic dsDNA virus sp.]|tara:strand:- start:13695 stop:14375 length:681 start_codon:yes stop_codon:yes gene_type:complete